MIIVCMFICKTMLIKLVFLVKLTGGLAGSVSRLVFKWGQYNRYLTKSTQHIGVTSNAGLFRKIDKDFKEEKRR